MVCWIVSRGVCRQKENDDMLENDMRTLLVRKMTWLLERNTSGVVPIGFLRHGETSPDTGKLDGLHASVCGTDRQCDV